MKWKPESAFVGASGLLKRLLFGVILVLVGAFGVSAQNATITWGTTHQTIDGFGVWSDTYVETLSSTQLDQVFSTTSGAGLTLLRVQIPDGDTTGNDNPGNCSSVGTACSGTVTDMKDAIARGAKVWATSWSPPASMKVINGAGGTPLNVFCKQGSHTTSLATASYSAYAAWLGNYISSLAAVGVPLYAVSVQNEPDFCPNNYGGAAWTAAKFNIFVKNYLAPTIANLPAPQNSTLIMIPEPGKSAKLGTYANAAFTDPRKPALLQIAATHNYDNWNGTTGSFLIPKKSPAYKNAPHYWMTEVNGSISGVNTYDPSIADAVAWAKTIHNWLTRANANAWHWWTINETENTTSNEGLYGPDRTAPAKRLWAIGQWSRFVRPGWIRVDSTTNPRSGIYVTAFKSPSGGNFAIVVVNTKAKSTSQTFNLSGFPTISGGTVTPYLTSSASNLAVQSSVAVTSTLTYTLPAQSVVTFYGATEGGAANASPTRFRIHCRFDYPE